MSVLTFQEARAVVERKAATVRVSKFESVSLLSAQNRVLAQEVVADRDLPPFRRAARDGYAVRAADIATAPAELKLIGEIRAGSSSDGIRIAEGEAAEIMTGASAPEGADCVVMVEHTSRQADIVRAERSVQSGDNIVPRGAEAHAGQTLLSRGTRLDYAAIAVAASAGCSNVAVFRKPRVAILSTGDEVVDIDANPEPHQIRNSNSYSLAAQVLTAGAELVLLPIAPDTREPLTQLIKEGLHSDLLLLAGGVSMGKFDLVEQVLTELGAEFFFTGALIQPGKPIVFGSVQGKYFFGLPGNPVSTMVTFELFARPMIDALSGASASLLPLAKAQLAADIKTKTGLMRFLPAFLQDGAVDLIRWQGSGDVVSTARANCYLVIPPDRERISAGEYVSILMR
jgi:molybdopterin molybdotransferase